MEAEVRVAKVEALPTRSGNTRFVLRDEDGNEYTTFREEVARQAAAAEGRRARITFHESSRGGYRNTYLDSVEPLEPDPVPEGDAEAIDEVAWKTAVDAAPWRLGSLYQSRRVAHFERLLCLRNPRGQESCTPAPAL